MGNNQCDGCIRGLPLNEFGLHRDVSPGGMFGCTKYRYENDLSDNIYEQLQKILNECIELGWKPNNVYDKIEIRDNGFQLWTITRGLTISVHDLFSKDSGLMEFVQWNEYCYNAKQHIHKMSDMTAKNKVVYFIINAIIPTPLSE